MKKSVYYYIIIIIGLDFHHKSYKNLNLISKMKNEIVFSLRFLTVPVPKILVYFLKKYKTEIKSKGKSLH